MVVAMVVVFGGGENKPIGENAHDSGKTRIGRRESAPVRNNPGKVGRLGKAGKVGRLGKTRLLRW